MRKAVLAMIVGIGLAALSFLFVGQIGLYRLELKSCFNNVQGLRSGAESGSRASG